MALPAGNPGCSRDEEGARADYRRDASDQQPAIGIILSESMKYLSAGMWWTAVFPGVLLVAIVLLVDKLGDNLRMVIDPYSAQE